MSKILVSGGLVPTTKDTLLDARTRVATFADIANIENPAKYLVISVEDTGKKYEVKKLASKFIGGIEVENARIDIDDPEALLDLNLAEEQRNEDEKIRQTNEAARIKAENDRKTAESSRIAAEKGRVSSESVRVVAEDSRVDNENQRKSNEQTRVASENARSSAESTRQGNEKARIDAENTRKTNETNRANAELLRVQAEGNRASTFYTLKGEMQNVIQEGETSVANTEAATSAANKVVQTYEGKVAEQDAKLTYLASKVIAADEEDLTSENGLLKLKDRNNLNGMGYIILRKDKTFAEQMTQTNTIYEIRYDLPAGDNVVVPSNCVLKFNGGSINGGSMNFNNTYIEGKARFIDTNVLGSIANEAIYDNWFERSNGSYKTEILKMIFSLFSDEKKYTLYLGSRHYIVRNLLISSSSSVSIIGGNTTIEVDSEINRDNWEECIQFKGFDYIEINNVKFTAPGLPSKGSDSDNAYYSSLVVNFRECNHVSVHDCKFVDMPYISPIRWNKIKEIHVYKNIFKDYDTGVTSSINEESNPYSVYIHDNTFDGTYNVSESININDSVNEFYCWIDNNYIANKTSASGIAVEGGNVGTNVFISNNIINNVKTGILLGGNLTAQCSNNKINGTENTSECVNLNGSVKAIFQSDIIQSPKDMFSSKDNDSYTFDCIFDSCVINCGGSMIVRSKNSKITLLKNRIEKTFNVAAPLNLTIVGNSVKVGELISVLVNHQNTVLDIRNNDNRVVTNSYGANFELVDKSSTIDLGVNTVLQWKSFYTTQYLEVTTGYNGECKNFKGAEVELYIKYNGARPRRGIVRWDGFIVGSDYNRIVNPGDTVRLRVKCLFDSYYQVIEEDIITPTLYVRLKDETKHTIEELFSGLIKKEDVIAVEVLEGEYHYLMALYKYTGKWCDKLISELVVQKESDAINDFDVVGRNMTMQNLVNGGAELPAYVSCRDYKAYDGDSHDWKHPTLGYIIHFAKYWGMYNAITRFLIGSNILTNLYISSPTMSIYGNMLTLESGNGEIKQLGASSSANTVIPISLL